MANTPKGKNALGVPFNQMNNGGTMLFGRKFAPSAAAGGGLGFGTGGTGGQIPLPQNPLGNPLSQPVGMTPEQQQALGTTQNNPLTLQDIIDMPTEQWDRLKASFGLYNNNG